jgi:urease accessory protein
VFERDGIPLRIERILLKGGDPTLNAKWGLLGFPVIGSMVCVTDKTELVDSLRKITNASIDQELFSVTQMDGTILCCFLGNSVERARNCFISAWRILRQEVIGHEAVIKQFLALSNTIPQKTTEDSTIHLSYRK